MAKSLNLFAFLSLNNKLPRMKALLLIISLLFLQTALAKGVYQTPESFLKNHFNDNVPSSKTIWLNKEKKQVISNILQHTPRFIRVKYWQKGEKTAWILHEVGKEKPITVGIIIENSSIKKLKVLEFRESRGWEVKHEFFTHQFNELKLTPQQMLNGTVDGISGATLSVRALKKMARISLYLDQQR